MPQGLRELFLHLPTPEPPAGLEQRILKQIAHERLFMLHRRRIVWSIPALGTAALFFSAVWMAADTARESGFFVLVSLVFTDTALMLSSWNDSALALLEALPIAGVTLSLGFLLLLLLSLRMITTNFVKFNFPNS